MVATLNRATTKPLADNKLLMAFEIWWPTLEEKLSSIPLSAPRQSAKRPSADLLEEVLGIVRDQSRTTQSIANFVEEMRIRELMRPGQLTPWGGLPAYGVSVAREFQSGPVGTLLTGLDIGPGDSQSESDLSPLMRMAMRANEKKS
jgi:hypothetical protein